MNVIADGWRFNAADFSIQAAGRLDAMGSVMLVRTPSQNALWHKLSEEEQDAVPLYVRGVGHTVGLAIMDANSIAEMHPQLGT
tara:strand:+ start:516 stop:764 length:249 start_codon:yes stop_codon:yes gene_type:complete